MASKTGCTEAILTRRVLSGDHEAFYELVKPLERMINFSAMSILRNHADVDEVAQEALLKAFTNLSRFRWESKFSTWVIQIAINEARMRRRKYRPWAHESLDTPPRTAEGRPSLANLQDCRQTPAALVETRELHGALGKALDSLPRKYRDVFALRDLRNLTTSDTALTLGISESLVKTRLLRARRKMRCALWQYDSRYGGGRQQIA